MAVDLADPDSATVSVDVTLPDLLNIFTSQNVGVLPVVDQPGGTRVVGIVEQRDLLRALHRPQ
jgi:CBS domain-containing protein